MERITPEEVRKNIILKEGVTYLDFTASGLAYRPIEEKIQNYLETYGNTHSEVGSNARAMTKLYMKARASLRHTLEVGDDMYLLPAGTGATGAIKKFQEIRGIYLPPATRKRLGALPESVTRPVVIVGPFEHHSNEVSFREALCDVARVRLGEDGMIDLEHLDMLLEEYTGREIIGTFSAASNVTGLQNPLEEISARIRARGGIMCVDGAGLSAHGNVSSHIYDALFLSPHKLISGPGSCGLLVIRKNLYDGSLPPTFAGGGTVTYVSRTSQRYEADVEAREDAGTPGILQLIRAAAAYELRNAVGLDVIAERERKLNQHISERFAKMPNVTLYTDIRKPTVSIFSFNIEGRNPYEVSDQLSRKFGIQTRAGCSCAGPYGHELLGLSDESTFETKPGWVRASFSYIHTEEDVDRFFEALAYVSTHTDADALSDITVADC